MGAEAVIIDIEQDEKSWKITASGVGSPHPYRATLRRCSMYHGRKTLRSLRCDGYHETQVATFIRKLRKMYEQSEGLFRV